MKKTITACLGALTLTLTATTVAAQETDWRSVTPKLQGCWDGEGLGGQVSECWLVSPSGRADGMFLLQKDEQPVFAEILVIDDFGDGAQMRLKHVNPDMTGWEDKDDYVQFTLQAASEDRLIFKGLSLIFDGDDKLRAELMMRMKDGIEMVPFDFIRTGYARRKPLTESGGTSK